MQSVPDNISQRDGTTHAACSQCQIIPISERRHNTRCVQSVPDNISQRDGTTHAACSQCQIIPISERWHNTHCVQSMPDNIPQRDGTTHAVCSHCQIIPISERRHNTRCVQSVPDNISQAAEVSARWQRDDTITHTLRRTITGPLVTAAAASGPSLVRQWTTNYLFGGSPLARQLTAIWYIVYDDKYMLNPIKPEFTIVFIHYKPRIAIAILDL